VFVFVVLILRTAHNNNNKRKEEDDDDTVFDGDVSVLIAAEKREQQLLLVFFSSFDDKKLTTLNNSFCQRGRRGRRGRASEATETSRSNRRRAVTVSSSSSESFSSGYVTKEELDEIARLKGLQLSTETVGPFFKITARRKIEDKRIEVVNADGEVLEKESEDMSVIATHDGFIAPFPFRILHLDTMRVYNSRINSQCTEEERKMLKSTFGVSILLGCESLRLGRDAGCTKAELLSIDDGNEYAPKLVKYYERLGFKIVRKVGDGLNTDLTDMLVWGGKGTRMNGDVNELLEKWSNVLRKTSKRNEEK
jgi:hypothetical protein